MKILTGQEAKDTLEELLKFHTPFPEPYVAGYFKESYIDVYTAFDNTTGDCWTESFKSEAEARSWAEGENKD